MVIPTRYFVPMCHASSGYQRPAGNPLLCASCVLALKSACISQCHEHINAYIISVIPEVLNTNFLFLFSVLSFHLQVLAVLGNKYPLSTEMSIPFEESTVA